VREHDLLLVVGRGADEVVAAWLRKHIFFNDDVRVENITSRVALMGFRGPGATALVNQLVESGGADSIFDGWTTQIANIGVTMMHSVPLGNDYLLMAEEKDAPALWSALSAAVASVGGAPVGELAIEAARIAAGSPRFGRELSEAYIPLEAGLKWAVSFSKGCYVGQEVIARMETHQRLAKRLVVLVADVPHPESSDGGISVGSWLGSLKALAYIKTALAKPGRQVEVVSDSGAQTMCVLSLI